MKKLLLGLSIFIVGVIVLWGAYIFPYPSCTEKQIEVTKHDLINSILEREIKLRELIDKANGKKFTQTEVFKQQLQKEKEKFYRYCDGSGASEYKNEYCEVDKETSLFEIDRYTKYRLRYHFDEESQDFFNQTQTYMGYEKFSTNPTGEQKIWNERFWIDDPSDENSVLLETKNKFLYPVKIVGYDIDYDFFNCADSPDNWEFGVAKLLASSEPIIKEDLVFIHSYYHHEDGSTRETSLIGIKAYIKKENK